MSLAWWSTCPSHEWHSKGKQSSDKWKLQKWSEMTNFEIKIQPNMCVFLCVCVWLFVQVGAANVKCSLRLAHTQPAESCLCVCVYMYVYVYVCVALWLGGSWALHMHRHAHQHHKTEPGSRFVGGLGQWHTIAWSVVGKLQSADPDDLPAWVCHM